MKQVYLVETSTESIILEDWETVTEMEQKVGAKVTPLPFYPSNKENEVLNNKVIHLKNRIRGLKGAITTLKKYKRWWEDRLVP